MIETIIQDWTHSAETINNDLLMDKGKSPVEMVMMMEEININSNEYREASMKFITILSLALCYILAAKDTTVAAWGVVFALNVSAASDGKSQREIAKTIGVSSGTISWHSKQFLAYSGLKL